MIKFGFNTLAMLTYGLGIRIPWAGGQVLHVPVKIEFKDKPPGIVAEDKILMAVWERGVGRTLACGSGATATVCAGVASGRLKPGRPIQVIMAGGALVISVPSPENSDKDPISITGPAEHVYSGYLDEKIWSIY